MINQVLWQRWLVNPAILGGAIVALWGELPFTPLGVTPAFAIEPAVDTATQIPSATVTTQPQTVETSVSVTVPTTASTSETILENPAYSATLETDKKDTSIAPTITATSEPEENSAKSPLLETETSVEVSEVPVEVRDTTLLEQIDNYSNEAGVSTLEQVTNVSQLRDVSPNDWAFEALRSLVERYACIAGYPDGTFRGNRALTRYEFAAGLNSCLQQIERLIAANTSEFVSREDLETLQRLIQDFEVELAALGTRVDTLEGRVAFLEDHQFSTTTKLDGEVILGFADILTGDSVLGEDVDDIAVFGSRTRLNFETSFTGRDRLRTRLEARGLETFTERTVTFEGNLAFADADADNDVELEELTYTFPVGESTEIFIAANGGDAEDFASTVNFLDGDGGSGALTRFGTRNPIYYLVEGAGIGIRQQLGDSLELSLGYLAGDANNPDDGGGLFNGAYGALAQLVYKPSDRFQIGFTYINSYNRETLTGSPASNPRTTLRTLGDQPVNINFQPPTVPTTPITFLANQQIPIGTALPTGTTLPAGTTLDAPTTLPIAITIPRPGPIPGVITVPAGTTIPAGISLPQPITLPIDFVLPAPITPSADIVLQPPTTPPLDPIVFNGTIGELLAEPSFAGIPLGFDLDIPVVSNSYGIEFSWRASEKFVLGGWVGYTTSINLSTGNGLITRGSFNSINGAITLAFPDLGKRGNLAGIIVGVEPIVLDTDIDVNQGLQDLVDPANLNPALIAAGSALLNSAPAILQVLDDFDEPDPDVSLHVEAFYQMQLTDNISITPGIIWITAPGSLATNSDLVIGTIRTTFSF